MESKNKTQEILNLFRKHGHIEYGEQITQNSHAVQASLIARARGCDNELILAAFLHDIGHLVPLEMENAQFETMGTFGMEAHDRWGEMFLREKGFSERIAATVKNHVAAKRYLCFADSDYYDQLSEASKETLRFQGGPMAAEEASAFENDPFFKDSILLRKIDEEAKEQDFKVKQEHWELIETLIDSALTS
jgi:2-amino-1-hydroxyethylphosphonate dioxygenase (glycine-forming)